MGVSTKTAQESIQVVNHQHVESAANLPKFIRVTLPYTVYALHTLVYTPPTIRTICHTAQTEAACLEDLYHYRWTVVSNPGARYPHLQRRRLLLGMTSLLPGLEERYRPYRAASNHRLQRIFHRVHINP